MPRQQRVRCHDRGDAPEDAASKGLCFRRQATALRVGEPQTFGPELFMEDAILFLEIIDDIALLLVHPTGERDEHEPKRVRQQRRHGVKATRGVFQWLFGRV